MIRERKSGVTLLFYLLRVNRPRLLFLLATIWGQLRPSESHVLDSKLLGVKSPRWKYPTGFTAGGREEMGPE